MVTINTLNGGNITITTGGSSGSNIPERDYSKTRVWWSSNESDFTDYELEGTISGHYDENLEVTFPIDILNIYSAPKIEIGTDVTGIGHDTFYLCANLIDIIIPETVTNIGDYAFGSCSSLTSIIIPESVDNIGNGVFEACDNLTTITVMGKSDHDA